MYKLQLMNLFTISLSLEGGYTKASLLYNRHDWRSVKVGFVNFNFRHPPTSTLFRCKVSFYGIFG